MLTLASLKNLLSYDAESGEFRWLVTHHRIRAGDPAGHIEDGRYRITIGRRKYLRSRLAWFYVHGSWPARLIDHRDRNSLNDRIANLREATPSQNTANRAKHKGSNRYIGVSRNGSSFRASVQIDRKPYILGTFKTEEEASAIRDIAAKCYYGEFAVLNSWSMR